MASMSGRRSWPKSDAQSTAETIKVALMSANHRLKFAPPYALRRRSSSTSLPAGLSLAPIRLSPMKVQPSPQAVEFFEKEVRPILVQHCYECHAQDEANGGLLLDSRAGWLRGGDTGAAITPGDPETSLLVEAVRYRNHDLQMPPQGRLADEQIAVLEKWVSLGAPDPREGTAAGPAPTGMTIEEGRKFWSFQPVADPPVPDVQAKKIGFAHQSMLSSCLGSSKTD